MGTHDTRPPATLAGRGTTFVSPSGRRCRATAAVAVRALLDLIDEAAVDGHVSVESARRIGAAVLSASGPLSSHYCRAESSCEAAFELVLVERSRIDTLGRLLTHSFAHLLDDPVAGIERKHLAQFFAAVHMILGEETREALKARCGATADRYRTGEGLVVWDEFYEDDEAALILEQVLVTIARSFRRFDPRKDWFMIVMNSNPSTVSLGSNVFVAKKPEDKVVREFSDIHLCRLFKALFASVRMDTFDDPRRRAFTARWGSEPDKVFGPLFVEMQGLCLQCGGTF